ADKNAFQYEAIFNGIEAVKPEYIESCETNQIPWSFVSKRPGLDLDYYRQLIKKIKDSDADIVFLHSSAYIMPAKLGSLFSKKKKRIIVRETQANHLKVKMEWVWLFVAMVIADRIVFLSREYREEIRKKLSMVYNSKKIAVIPNGLDLDLYKPSLFAHSNTAMVIGMQSRLVRIKDHMTLLEAFSLLLRSGKITEGQLILKIAGDGDYYQALIDKTSALKLGNAVEFTGMLNEKELVEFLRSLDIYIHASLGETMSTAIMQAMAFGLPMVASDVRGIHNMIQDGITGRLVPAQDPDAMRSAIQELIKDPGKRKSLGKAARAYAEMQFSNEKMVDAYRELFTSC
ncbi:MAG: glycosyltransferase family 4 protein, partial [Ferruginibacter sp.]